MGAEASVIKEEFLPTIVLPACGILQYPQILTSKYWFGFEEHWHYRPVGYAIISSKKSCLLENQ